MDLRKYSYLGANHAFKFTLEQLSNAEQFLVFRCEVFFDVFHFMLILNEYFSDRQVNYTISRPLQGAYLNSNGMASLFGDKCFFVFFEKLYPLAEFLNFFLAFYPMHKKLYPVTISEFLTNRIAGGLTGACVSGFYFPDFTLLEAFPFMLFNHSPLDLTLTQLTFNLKTFIDCQALLW